LLQVPHPYHCRDPLSARTPSQATQCHSLTTQANHSKRIARTALFELQGFFSSSNGYLRLLSPAAVIPCNDESVV
jgi:hypothetical protein